MKQEAGCMDWIRDGSRFYQEWNSDNLARGHHAEYFQLNEYRIEYDLLGYSAM
jgi:hypothetical protein